jgi:propanol-preferring alcohol dehydrogenase
MLLDAPGAPLRPGEITLPDPGAGQVLVRVRSCGVCRTDLHVRDGELPNAKRPLVLGHQIVGVVAEVGAGVETLAVGERIGVPWLGWTCGECRHCRRDAENLCDRAKFMGYQLDGGYAALTLADARFALPLPASYTDLEAAPLLCAGLIGYRALRFTGDAERIGLYGFGSAAHIVAQVARHQGRRVFAFTRPGDQDTMAFALGLGAEWAGGSDQAPPELLDAAIIFAPAGALVPRALSHVEKGGRVVCAGIHMSDIPGFAYELLWGERSLISVANLSRRDGVEFLDLAPRVPIQMQVTAYPIEQAEHALEDLRAGTFNGAAVLTLS